MTGRTPILPWWLGGERGKDDRKQNTLAPLSTYIIYAGCSLKGQWHDIFASDFNNESSSLKPLKITLGSF
jgi:hypothetical protein